MAETETQSHDWVATANKLLATAKWVVGTLCGTITYDFVRSPDGTVTVQLRGASRGEFKFDNVDEFASALAEDRFYSVRRFGKAA